MLLRALENLRPVRKLVVASTAALMLSGCVTTGAGLVDPGVTGSLPAEGADLGTLSKSYADNPRDKWAAIRFATALRDAGQSGQAVAVLQQATTANPKDPNVKLAYAKALAADGQFEQALTIVDQAIEPDRPNWNALMVKGAILDQMGQNGPARQIYQQALVLAPDQPSIEANLGLSYAMTNDLDQAETHLRRAAEMPGAGPQVQQNLAFVLGLQGRFSDAEEVYARVLPPDQVKDNMAYVRSLLTQQDRWAAVRNAG